jgi:hemerythrin
MSASNTFGWNDAFLLGFHPMDDVHREFVDIVDALLGCADADMTRLLDDFARHAESHFAQERAWMEKTAFPATDCHVDEHNAVMKSLVEIQPLVAAGRFDIGRSFVAELVRWFPGHADYMDASLAQWMVKKQLGGAPVVFRRSLGEAPSA